MNKIEIGKIVNAVALRGEVKVYSYAENPENFEEYGEIFVEDEIYEIENVRYQLPSVVLKLKGVNDRNAAESLKDKILYVDEGNLPELPEGQYYIKDIIGLDVYSEEGEKIGVLKDVLTNTAQDVYEIKKPNGSLAYIPGVPEFIKLIDLPAKRITVHLIEGLI